MINGVISWLFKADQETLYILIRVVKLLMAFFVKLIVVLGISIICDLQGDNGWGMNPEKMFHCMSLGYSLKSKLANTIGKCIRKIQLIPRRQMLWKISGPSSLIICVNVIYTFMVPKIRGGPDTA